MKDLGAQKTLSPKILLKKKKALKYWFGFERVLLKLTENWNLNLIYTKKASSKSVTTFSKGRTIWHGMTALLAWLRQWWNTISCLVAYYSSCGNTRACLNLELISAGKNVQNHSFVLNEKELKIFQNCLQNKTFFSFVGNMKIIYENSVFCFHSITIAY